MARKNGTVIEKGERYFVFEYQAGGSLTGDDLTKKAARVIQECSRASSYKKQERCLRAGYCPDFLNLIVSKTARLMIVHHPDSLHE